VWWIDFTHKQREDGRMFRLINVIDDLNREAIVMDLKLLISNIRVIRELKQIISWRGKPEMIRCDNGPEFASWAMRLFLESKGVTHVLIQPGSPWQNGFAESFVGTFRSECLDPELFFNLADAQLKISLWVKFYNEDRPHSSLGYLQPLTYKKKWDELLLEKEETVL
jgi:putative transposase